MKKLLFVLFLTILAVSLFADLTAWPKNTLAELFTTTQCTNCPDAYNGLEVVQNQYDHSEFNSIRYYSAEGGGAYSFDGWEATYDYYGITYTPQAMFNGTINVPGSGPEIADGSSYLNVVTPHYFEASPIKLIITSFDNQTGALSVTAKLMNDDTDISNAVIRFALVEDNVEDSHTHIVRYLTKENIAFSSVGEELTFNKTLTIDENYVNDNLRAVTWVQLPNHTILQSESTYDYPTEKIRAMVPFNPNVWDTNYDHADPYYMYEGEYFSVINFGTATTFTIDIVMDNAPNGWDVSFCDHSNCYMGAVDVDLPVDGFHDFHAVVMPSSEGECTYHFDITVAGTDIHYQVPFYYSTSASANDNTVAPKPMAVLNSAYPNPFSVASAKGLNFSFSLLENMKNVDLSVYNLKGQMVKNLYSSYCSKGDYSISWDLKDKTGNNVPNGLYFYMLKTQNDKIIKKLTIIK